MDSEIKAPTRDEAIVRSEVPGRLDAWRVLAGAGALAVTLSAGWLAGMKTREKVETPQALAMVAATGSSLQASAREWSQSVRARVAGWTRPTDQASAAGPVEEHAREAAVARGQAGSEPKIEALDSAVERLASLVDTRQGQLIAKLDQLVDRVDRWDRGERVATAPLLTKLDQLSERVVAIERSVSVATGPQPTAAAPPQPISRIQAAVPPVAPAKPMEKPLAGETRKNPEWVIREVINGTAILQGPRGIIGVSTGDLVPGVGRVRSIARQGGRWVVATNKGLITAR